MKKSYTFISKNPKILLEMLMLRRAGVDTYFLAEQYNCDRDSIRYQCRKYQIFPTKTVFIRNDKSAEIFNPERIARQVLVQIVPPKTSNWVIIDGERVNTGKSYSDYLASLSPYKKSTVQSII